MVEEGNSSALGHQYPEGDRDAGRQAREQAAVHGMLEERHQGVTSGAIAVLVRWNLLLM